MYILILFAISLSLDAAAVGFSYGIKKIRLPINSLAALFIVSALMSAAGTFFGGAVSSFLSAEASKLLSFLLLLGLGLWMSADSLRETKKPPKKTWDGEKSFRLMLGSVSLCVKIIKQPIDCDFDKSSSIEFLEACYLAFLLSLDALCSCASLAAGGSISYIAPILVGVFQTAFLFAGDAAGRRFSNAKFLNAGAAALLPGAILICVAFIRFFS